MKLLLTLILAYAGGIAANIHFTFVPPTCDTPTLSARCFDGQICTHEHECVTIRASDLASPPRSDGRCGKDFNDATCDPKGPYGPCCSSHGYCGKTDDHCLVSNGCQSGCTNTPPTSTAPTTPLNEPTLSNPTAGSPTASATGAVTTDGTCGAQNGGTVCGNWKLGSCCSMYA